MVTEQAPTNQPDQQSDPDTHPARSLPDERLRALVDAFSSAGLAKLIGVSAATPARWVSGQHRPRPQSTAQLVALDQVFRRASLIWGPSAVRRWLWGSNSYLEGARPVDALQYRRTSAVLGALDAEIWGGAS